MATILIAHFILLNIINGDPDQIRSTAMDIFMNLDVICIQMNPDSAGFISDLR